MGKPAFSKFNLLIHNPVRSITKFVIFGFDPILMSISGAADSERAALAVCIYIYPLSSAVPDHCMYLLREDVRGVAGVELATPFFQDLFYTPSKLLAIWSSAGHPTIQ